MAIFKYVAKNEHAETVKGKVEARTKQQAAVTLIDRGLLVIEINPITAGSFSALRQAFFGIKQTELVNFTRQLATMISAGLPLATALSILQNQTKPEMAALVNKLLKDVESGETFAKALGEHEKVFSRVYIQLVKAGEVGGVLDNVLDRLAINLEKEKDFRAKTKGAMIYPLIVIAAMVIVGFIMMVFVVPKLTQMYQDFNAELPLATKALIAVSTVMARFWWLIILLAVGGVVGLRTWSQTDLGEKKLDEWLNKIPVYGQLRTKMTLTEFARTMSLLLSSGVPLLEAMQIVSQAMSSRMYRDAVSEAKDDVEKGVPLSQALGRYEIMPPILPEMIAVGEETGKMDEILLKLSEYYEKESEYAVKNLTTAMEPLIMIVLGVGVGLMVIAVIMPIYNLTNQF
ncbi:MAG: hypothetical protein GF381_01320 [Candidatus Pacebacteria bacterium]|nr:hypothetical protein [Candidatus Paceibacterota bacterium]